MLIILCFLMLVTCTNGIDIACSPDTCRKLKVKCADIDATTCEGVLTSGGGFCGCCKQCVPLLKEGEKCISNPVVTSSSGICDEGLICQSHVCRKTLYGRDLTAPCAAKLAEINARLNNDTEHMLLGLERPRCEDDGTYKPYQFGGSQAICVTADGTRLYDYMVYRWEAGDTMDCQCARDQYAYQQTGMIGKMFYCDNNGNYASVGCSGSVCYCQDKMGKQVGSSTVNISEKYSMNC